MKILCITDSLGPGGAQRQLVTLATGLRRRGHDVRFVTYHFMDHFAAELESGGVKWEVVGTRSKLVRLWKIRKLLRTGWQDVVVAFLEGPCFYATVGKVGVTKWKLVAGERSANPALFSGMPLMLKRLYVLADAIVTNSHANRLMLVAALPRLAKKVFTIYNAVPDVAVRRMTCNPSESQMVSPQTCRIVVAARIDANKNLNTVVEAVKHANRQAPRRKIVVDWFGFLTDEKFRGSLELKDASDGEMSADIRLHQPTKDIWREYNHASAVGLFSFFEGLPNSVCEGMMCGKPIVLSDVCDAGRLVKDGVNGFLCNPDSHTSISSALVKMANLSPDEEKRFGKESRERAEQLFNEGKIVSEYEKLFSQLVRGEFSNARVGWPRDEPESAKLSGHCGGQGGMEPGVKDDQTRSGE